MLPHLGIVLASMSTIKVQAVAKAAKGVFGDNVCIDVVAIDAKSGVNSQPVGMNEIMSGASNRLWAARHTEPRNQRICIGIESGLLDFAGMWTDVAVVMVQQGSSNVFMSTSIGVPFPAEACSEARRRGFETNTAAEVMAEWGIFADAKDPHITLVGQSRESLLVPPLTIALNSLRRAQ